MIIYAKITNEETGLCQVGLGTNEEFYKSIGMELLDVQKSDMDNQWYLSELCPMKSDDEKNAEEQARIQSLSMTKSDFFDGMIRAFGLDQDDLQPAIQLILDQLQVSDIDKKVAMNNYKNAKDFYRKHTLFALLSGREIPISETQSIKISSTQWDRFFDETNKGNAEAYKELFRRVTCQYSIKVNR